MSFFKLLIEEEIQILHNLLFHEECLSLRTGALGTVVTEHVLFISVVADVCLSTAVLFISFLGCS